MDDDEQPAVANSHIERLAEIFVRHNAHEKLGVHLIHGHFKIPADTIMLGTNFENPSGRWTKPTSINEVNLDNVHGHIFVLTPEHDFVAYEYQDGPLPDLSGIDPAFFTEFISYIVDNDLASVLGLQVLIEGVHQSMFELILDEGTVMLDTAAARNCTTYRQTGWMFELQNGQPLVRVAGEKHALLTNGNHKVFFPKNPPKLDSVANLKEALKMVDVLSSIP